MAGAILVVGFLLAATLSVSDPSRLGADYRLYTEAARTWLDTGTFYPARQLAGTYGMDPPPILYPPYALVLFVPFTVLPAILWWSPVVIVAWRLRHAPRWTWPLLVLLLGWPTSIWLVLCGNPMMWAAAALALGWSPLVMLKPSLAPFAFMGIRRRQWWVLTGAGVLVALAFLPMWPDFLTVLRNFDSGRGLGYSLPDYPLMLGVWITSRAARLTARRP